MKITSLTSKSQVPQPILSKMLLLFLLAMFFQNALGMHLQAQPSDSNSNVYNKNLYLGELNNIQSRLSSGLQAIKDKFTLMNQQLAKTNPTQSAQIIKLQQTLAEQRDGLYNIQKFLSLPFALKSCECINFSDAQKKQLQKQIGEVTKSIKELQQKVSYDETGKPYDSPKCPNGNCPTAIYIKKQISQLQNYAKIMNDTINSNCCSKIIYKFTDNLINTNGWIYGKLTQQQYMSALELKIKAEKTTKCPESLPFANEKINECFSCPKETPVFNLQTRTCQKGCEAQNLVLDPKIHNCDVNRTCPVGQFFSTKTSKCQVDLGTASRCPQDKPVWSDQTMSCQVCPKQHPFYDINVRSCRSCTENEIWDAFTLTCYSKANYNPIQCPQGSAYNVNTKKCESTSSQPTNPSQPVTPGTNPSIPTPGTGTSALCPPDTPFWNQNQFICAKCPQQTPWYNDATQKCEACPPNTSWNTLSKSCVQSGHNCKSNQFWNDKTNKCQQIKPCNADQTYNAATGQCQSPSQIGKIGLCPPETPFWNDKSLNCQKCHLITPLWNPTTRTCTACPTGSAFDTVSNQCKDNVQCPTGTLYNSNTQKCEAVICPQDKPVFNSQKGVCEACPTGTTYNFVTKVCEVTSQKSITSVCPKQTPYWNGLKMACEACPNGQQQNATTKLCEPITVSHFISVGVFRHNLALHN